MPEVWPFFPSTDIKETLAWLTDVRITPQGEMRDSLRDGRQKLALSFSVDDQQRARALELLRSNILGDWYLPFWPDRTLIAGELAATDTSIAVNTDADYRAGGYALALLDDESFALLQVDTVGSGVINLAAPVGVTLTGSAVQPVVVAPARVAYLPAGLKESRAFRGYSTLTGEFALRDQIDLGGHSYPSHDSLPVLTDPVVVTQPVSGGMSQGVQLVDNGFGPVVMESVRDVVEEKSMLYFVDNTIADRWERRKWLHHLRGRDGAFWMPSGARDLVLAAAVADTDTELLVDPIVDDANVADLVGRHLQIDYGAGLLHREVTAAAVSGFNHSLTIAAPGVALGADAVVSLMVKSRLDADQLTVNHEAGFISRVSAPVVEVVA
ncbi:hypothetical protein GQE99_14455 [Maritimibacter sp. DP07]|uniref:Uncharacterized protein n=1 Tax=Maritimibacter harenae TaxID=2606218 RepID=A0A845MB26_9RHOB|nr:hypothetical protein [Maritimibacter harenae]MZR14221.1 hypothetical protein [Maritimibacter harenae]